MPYNKSGQGFSRSEFLSGSHFSTSGGTLIAPSYLGFVKNTYGNVVVKKGTVLGRVTDQNSATYMKLVPKVAAPALLAGADTAVGILYNDVVLPGTGNEDSHNVAYVTHGRVKSALVIDEGSYGAKASTKSQLKHIEFE